MKKILILPLILLSLFVKAQYPLGYTGINAKYDWLGGRFRALHVPGFNTTPSLVSGQWIGAGAVGVDTVNHQMWFYSGNSWHQLSSGGSASGNYGNLQINRFGFATPGTDSLNYSSANGLTIKNRLGIGTTSPNASAALEILSTTKGLLMPRMTTTQQNAIGSPVAGLVIFNTDSSSMMQYTGAQWQSVRGGSGGGGSQNLSYNSGTHAIDITSGTSAVIPLANTTTTGLISASDWNSFNNKVSSYWTAFGSDIYYNTGGVAIGNSSINSKAILDLVSTTKGLLVPRMNTTQQNAIATPPNGLLIYNTDSAAFRWYNGSAWSSFGAGSGGSPTNPAGNYGNLQLNRNGAFSAASTDSLTYSASGGLAVKNIITGNAAAMGATSVASSAILDLVSTTKGLLAPRMNTTQQNAISSPAAGLLIYNTDSAAFRWYNGSAWVSFGSGGGGTSTDAASYHTMTAITDTSFSLNRPNGTKDTVEVSLANGDKGDLTVNNGWTNWTIDNLAITNAKIATGVDAAKIADGSVSNAEFQYINSLTSNAQTQIDSKQAAIQFKDEGSNLSTSGTVTGVNFTGAGVTATFGSGTVTVNVSSTGGGGRYMPFQVGVSSHAPSAGDGYFLIPSDYATMRLFINREGQSQMDTTNGVVTYQYHQHLDTVFVYPNFSDSERVQVWAYTAAGWSTDVLPAPTSYDPDAQAYFSAQGVTSTTDKDNINALILALKAGNNVWGKTKAIYLAYGDGKVNAKSPGTFDLTGTNFPTIAADGYEFDGVNDAANTNIVANTNLTSGAEFHAMYVKSSTDDKPISGAIDAGNGTYIFPRSSGSLVFRLQNGGDATCAANASATGRYVLARRGGAPLVRVTKNGSQICTNATTPSTLSTYPIYLGALNNTGTLGSFNTCTIGIYIIGLDLTDTQMGEVDTAISNFITATGR